MAVCSGCGWPSLSDGLRSRFGRRLICLARSWLGQGLEGSGLGGVVCTSHRHKPHAARLFAKCAHAAGFGCTLGRAALPYDCWVAASSGVSRDCFRGSGTHRASCSGSNLGVGCFADGPTSSECDPRISSPTISPSNFFDHRASAGSDVRGNISAVPDAQQGDCLRTTQQLFYFLSREASGASWASGTSGCVLSSCFSKGIGFKQFVRCRWSQLLSLFVVLYGFIQLSIVWCTLPQITFRFSDVVGLFLLLIALQWFRHYQSLWLLLLNGLLVWAKQVWSPSGLNCRVDDDFLYVPDRWP